jgi:hypothetical protein
MKAIRRLLKSTMALATTGIISLAFGMAQASNQCVQPPEGLISWWPGDGNANDIQGSNNGTLQGGVTFGPGLVGQAFRFDGVDGFVSFGKTIGNFGVANFTIDFWIKTTSVRQEGLLGKRPVCGDSSFWDIRLGSGPTSGTPDPGVIGVELDGDEAGTNYNPIRTKTTVNDGNFHHLAVVRRGVTMSVYIDGRLDTSRTTPGVTNLRNDAVLAAGVSTCTGIDGTEFFRGQLDEIEIFDRALTSSEIAAIFGAGSAGKCKKCAANVTSQIRITRGPILFDSATQLFVQRVKLTNVSNSVISGSAYLVLDNLGSSKTRLANQNGVTQCAPPLGSPYRKANLGLDDALSPGEYGVVILKFRHPLPGAITYTPRVLAGDGPK